MDIRRSNTRCPEHDLHVLQIGIHGATGKPTPIPGASSLGVLANPFVALFETDDNEPQVLSNTTWVDVEFDVALDSGSQEHVCDEVDCPGYMLEDSPGSSRGQCFIVGDGGRLANRGQMRLNMQPLNDSNQPLQSIFQIAKVTRPLMSVGKTCDNGMEILFTEERAVVRDKRDGSELCVFERKPGGLYIWKFRLKAPSPGFARQG